MATQEIVQRRAGAPVRNGGRGDPGLRLQQLGRKIERASGPAAGAEAEPSGVLLGIDDQVADTLDREILAHHQDQRPGRHLGNRRQLGEVERIVRMQRLRDQRAGRDEEQRVAVGRRAGELAHGRNEIAAGFVFNQHRRVEAFAHLLGDDACHDIGGAAGREPDQHADGAAGKILSVGGNRKERNQCHAREQGQRRAQTSRKSPHGAHSETAHHNHHFPAFSMPLVPCRWRAGVALALCFR